MSGEEVIKKLIRENLSITVMESCTGGAMSSAITDVSDASEIFPGSYVTYSNPSKIRCGVPGEIIGTYGVYSEETAAAMASACRTAYGTDLGIGITGSLGRKDPNNPDSVSGQVYYAISTGKKTWTYFMEIPEEISTRTEMKQNVVNRVLHSLEEILEER